MLRAFWLLAAALAIGLVAVARMSVSASLAAAPATAQATPPQPPTRVRLEPQAADQGYVGTEKCRACHRAEVTVFGRTAHSQLTSPTNDQRMDCETCHGAGKAHSDAEEAAKGEDAATAAANKLIFAFKGSSSENAARCQNCHVSARPQQGFDHSPHANVGLACSACHSAHLVEAVRRDHLPRPPLPQAQAFERPRPDAERRWLAESQLKDSQPALCFTCHAQIRLQFALLFHHRVPEGAINCTDCHNPHGTPNPAMLVAPGWETCTNCHTDKHGPFLFEHAAVKVEGCAVCHSPHGSTSRFMLLRRESRFLCLQCHGDPHSEQEQVSVPHSRLGFQTRGDCTRCHIAIHGSNFNPQFLQ